MGYFTKPREARAALAPLSQERILHALSERGTPCDLDDDGDIVGGWDGCYVHFFTEGERGEVLRVRGMWWGLLAPERLGDALRVGNEWSSQSLFPRPLVHEIDEGVLIAADYTVDYEHGLTDAQLELHISCALSACGAFFDHVNERFPEEAATAKAEFEAE
ncbi:MAG: YbjN domain-containing protein [Propioniciclava sp.]|uniref:YbjN domain-containing protein n=1 Tax=Propioniciclava sp. TaxID=2038686 RepID=UPI0039E6F214